MKADAINDRESLEAWLNARPEATRRADTVAIAQRAAQRVFPLWSSAMRRSWARKANLTALPVLRSLLTVGVLRKFSSSEARSAFEAANAATSAAAEAMARIANSERTYGDAMSKMEDTHSAAYAAVLAVDQAASGAAIEAAAKAVYIVAEAVGYQMSHSARAAAGAERRGELIREIEANAALAAHEFTKSVQADAIRMESSGDLLAQPLWLSPAPDWFTDINATARAIWASEPEVWSFWIRWWDGALSGKQLDWELQKQVALIPDNVWEKGPAAMAEAIAVLEVPFAIGRTPNAEVLRVNPDTGLIRLDPLSHLSGRHLADVVDTLKDATTIFDAHGGANGPYHSLGDECRIITDGCDRYAHRPLMLLRICRRVVERVTLKEANGDCPKADPLVQDFIGSVAGAAGDLMAFDSDVREAEAARATIVLSPPSQETARNLLIAADASAEISEGDLKAELPVNARQAISDQDTTERSVAMYETKSRLLRILALTKANGKAVSDHLERHPVVYSSILAVLLFLLA